ncbi:MAG: phosphohistidine phosphatase SixA [Bacteroidota bacterium]
MNLYLVQHAQPKKEEEDPQRPLSEKGWSDIQKVSKFASQHLRVRVQKVFHSGKTRAHQTAEALAQHLDPPGGVAKADGLEPLADPASWVKRLNEPPEDIMLVGHLPHLAKLSSYLLCQDETKRIVDFQMGGIVCLRRDESGIWSIQWAVIPQIID